MTRLLVCFVVGVFALAGDGASAAPIRVAVFDVDATPPIGSPLAYDPTREITEPLSCRGIVLLGDEAPIVLCAVDWLGIANDGNREFRERLAAAAETTPERVAVHTLHQHDAPMCDFSTDALTEPYGFNRLQVDTAFARTVMTRAADAVRAAIPKAQPVTHLGLGEGIVEKVASNRRILGPDGKVVYVRYTATRDPKIRAFPEGVIDPKLRMISLWNGDTPLVALTYYATHPQSYYRTGQANPDFPGMARNARQQATGVPHVHFNGAGGNIGAGKYNDGAHENRQVLADRVAAGMEQAWESTKKAPIDADDLGWRSVPVQLPAGSHLNEEELLKTIADENADAPTRFAAGRHLIWLRRCQAGDTIDIGCLRLGRARVLHLPGELFVEYQLAAQDLRPDLFVAMAAYGEYAPGYIGTSIAYEQGGYEPSARASRVAPGVESVLIQAIQTLLDAEGTDPGPLGVEAARRETEAARAAVE